MTGKTAGVVVGTVAAATLIQSTWLPAAPVAGEWADLALVTAILFALLGGTEAGLTAGLTAGLLMGWLGGMAAAAFFLSRVVVVAMMAQLRVRWHRENLLVQVIAVMIGSLACEAVFALLCPSVLQSDDWLSRVVARACLNAVVTPFAALVVARLPVPSEVTGA